MIGRLAGARLLARSARAQRYLYLYIKFYYRLRSPFASRAFAIFRSVGVKGEGKAEFIHRRLSHVIRYNCFLFIFFGFAACAFHA